MNELELAKKLANLLHQAQHKEPKLLQWRFDLHEAEGVEIGLKNNKIGGPYTAPAYKQSISGELYLIWKDNRFTSTKIDAGIIEDFSSYFNVWQASSYQDPDGVGLFTPDDVPQVELTDPAVLQILDRDFTKPYELLQLGLERLKESGARKIDGRVKCFRDNRVIMNSDGFEIETRQTPADFYFLVNDSYSEGYGEKKWPEPADVERVIGNVGRVGKMLTVESNEAPAGKTTLIFHPGIFESLLDHFLLTNLYGSLVINRQSRFSLDDFIRQRQVIRPDLSLEVNNLLPLRSFSYRCTSEGIPGGRMEFISDGRLQTPIFSLKYAKKAGMKPTPIPGGGYFIKTEKGTTSWEELIKNVEHGLIVYSVLGLHTQDSSSGSFSLTADQALLVKNGEIGGRIKAVINGDFLDSLNQPSSLFGRMAGEDNPGYAMSATAVG